MTLSETDAEAETLAPYVMVTDGLASGVALTEPLRDREADADALLLAVAYWLEPNETVREGLAARDGLTEALASLDGDSDGDSETLAPYVIEEVAVADSEAVSEELPDDEDSPRVEELGDRDAPRERDTDGDTLLLTVAYWLEP